MVCAGSDRAPPQEGTCRGYRSCVTLGADVQGQGRRQEFSGYFFVHAPPPLLAPGTGAIGFKTMEEAQQAAPNE